MVSKVTEFPAEWLSTQSFNFSALIAGDETCHCDCDVQHAGCALKGCKHSCGWSDWKYVSITDGCQSNHAEIKKGRARNGGRRGCTRLHKRSWMNRLDHIVEGKPKRS